MRLKMTLALGSLVAVAAGASAITLALFSDQADVEQGFTAGTVGLHSYRDMGDTVPGPLFYITPEEGAAGPGKNGRHPTGLWAPGDTVQRVLIVQNDGTLDLLLTTVGADLEAGSEALAAALTYTVTLDKPGTQVVAQGNLADLIASDAAFATPVHIAAQPNLPLNRRKPIPLYFTVTLPLDADNSLQGEQLKVQFTVSAEQARNN